MELRTSHEYFNIKHILFTFGFQELESQKTNNGIHYRLQLLYANGEYGHFTYCPVSLLILSFITHLTLGCNVVE